MDNDYGDTVKKDEEIQASFSYFYSKTGEIGMIPPKYRTVDMCVDYFFKTGDASVLPIEDKEDLFQEIFSRTGNFAIIPKEYRTKDMSEKAFAESMDNFKFIPDEFKTLEMCKAVFAKTHKSTLIPKEYLQGIYEEYFDELLSSNVTNILAMIPKEYITQEMANRYFDFYKQWKEVLYDRWCRAEEIWQKNKRDLDAKWWREDERRKYKEARFDMNPIPEQFRTQEMYNYSFSEERDIHSIPEQFRTFEMCQISFSLNQNLAVVPEKFREQVCEDYFMKTFDLGGLPKSYRIVIAQNLLTILNDLTFTKEQLLYNLGCSDSQFNKVMNIIAADDINIYNQIKAKIDGNARNYVINTQNRVDDLNDLVISMDLNGAKELSKEQKILFTYQFYSQMPYRSLETIWAWISRDANKSKELFNFFRKYLKFKTSNDMANYEVLSLKEQEKEQLPSWIKSYNLDKSMGKNGREVLLTFVNGDERTVVDKKGVQLVLTILKENHIPTKNCIVNEAVRQYATGDLNKFIENLQDDSAISKKENTGFKK